MRRLNFVVAGVQKCGTSSLWSYLNQHPCLSLASPKETHFFDNELVDWRDPDYGILHAMFDSPREGQLLGEATPITFYWTPAQARLFRYAPDIKIILIFRDPIERAYSGWRMGWSQGWDTLTFSEAIRAGRLRILDESEQPGFSRFFSVVERGFYGRQLKQLLKLFSLDQMLFVRSEDLITSHARQLTRIADFLKTPPFPDLPQESINKATKVAYPSQLTEEDSQYLARIYRNDLLEFADISKVDVSKWRTLRG